MTERLIEVTEGEVNKKGGFRKGKETGNLRNRPLRGWAKTEEPPSLPIQTLPPCLFKAIYQHFFHACTPLPYSSILQLAFLSSYEPQFHSHFLHKLFTLFFTAKYFFIYSTTSHLTLFTEVPMPLLSYILSLLSPSHLLKNTI